LYNQYEYNMTATDQKLIELLQEKISQISKLMESYDRYALEQWKTEVSMILEPLIGSDSRHYKDFVSIRYTPVFIGGDVDESEYEDSNKEGLNQARVLLQSVLFAKNNDLL